MTQIIQLANDNCGVVGKPIVLTHELWNDGTLRDTHITASSYDYVMLLDKDESGAYDLILGWDNPSGWDKDTLRRSVFLGHWNDGSVEPN